MDPLQFRLALQGLVEESEKIQKQEMELQLQAKLFNDKLNDFQKPRAIMLPQASFDTPDISLKALIFCPEFLLGGHEHCTKVSNVLNPSIGKVNTLLQLYIANEPHLLLEYQLVIKGCFTL